MTDDEMLERLRRVLGTVDADDEFARDIAYAAQRWIDADAELAELIFDSAVDQVEALVRSTDDLVRLLTFSTAEVTIEVELGRGQLIGQVVPPTPTGVELLGPDGEVVMTTASDDLGVFTIDDVPPGPSSLVCRAHDGSWSVRTAWTGT